MANKTFHVTAEFDYEMNHMVSDNEDVEEFACDFLERTDSFGICGGEGLKVKSVTVDGRKFSPEDFRG
jgi:hypothetical protein